MSCHTAVIALELLLALSSEDLIIAAVRIVLMLSLEMIAAQW